ncbi:MAG TPA: hypothetical protein VLM40_12655 [Gemmata sp.]|nr:hypothetical protein [Gemmata sp.]
MRSLIMLLLALAILAGCKRKHGPTGRSSSERAAATDARGEHPGPNKSLGTFTIGKSTTYITGPVDATGHIDYAAALNERLSKGVTPENNANVLFWKALGPNPLGPAANPPGLFEALKMSEPPAGGDYFVRMEKYAATQLASGLGTPDAAQETLTRLMKQPWTAKQNPGVASWLRANEKPLALVIEGTKRTHYYSPLLPGRTAIGPSSLINSLLPGAQMARELAGAITVRAMLRVGEGQVEDAWQDLLACHRLGRVVGKGGTLIEGLVGFAIEQIACRGDVVFLAHTQPDAKQIAGYLRDLAALPPLPSVVDKVDLTDRFTMLQHIMLIDRGGIDYLNSLGGGGGNRQEGGFFAGFVLNGINWDPGLENANRWFDRIVAALRETSRSDRKRQFDTFVTDIRAMKDIATDKTRLARMLAEGRDPGKAKGEVIGDILITLLLPAVDKVQDASDRTAQVFENVAIAFALAWYARDNGNYPPTLESLAKYLGRAPVDIFTGKMPIYKPTAHGYRLYSVGPNGQDDGGLTAEEKRGCDDIVVRMPPR